MLSGSEFSVEGPSGLSDTVLRGMSLVLRVYGLVFRVSPKP